MNAGARGGGRRPTADGYGSAATGSRRPVGLRAVAELAGVSVSTVSRVLSDGPYVSEGLRTRVVAAAAAAGYQPNVLARSLRRGATRSIGFAVRDISNPIVAEQLLGAESVLRDHGYSMLLTNSESRPELDVENVRVLWQRRVDGLLLAFADETYEPLREELARIEVPFVVFDRELPDELPWSGILNDYSQGVADAVAHLAELGHRSLGVVAPPREIRFGRVLVADVEAACARVGIEPRSVHGPMSSHHGYAATTRLVGTRGRPSALLVSNNRMLVGALRALRELRVAVPRRLSLVVVDRLELLEYLDPPLDAVVFDPVEMGRLGADLLLRRLEGGAPERIVLPTQFVRARSSAPPSQRARARRP